MSPPKRKVTSNITTTTSTCPRCQTKETKNRSASVASWAPFVWKKRTWQSSNKHMAKSHGIVYVILYVPFGHHIEFTKKQQKHTHQKHLYIGSCQHCNRGQVFKRNSFETTTSNGYINPYYWVYDHLNGNYGSLAPLTLFAGPSYICMLSFKAFETETWSFLEGERRWNLLPGRLVDCW